jgi:hypothetical protein
MTLPETLRIFETQVKICQLPVTINHTDTRVCVDGPEEALEAAVKIGKRLGMTWKEVIFEIGG